MTPTAQTPILMFSPEPWLEDQETRMTSKRSQTFIFYKRGKFDKLKDRVSNLLVASLFAPFISFSSYNDARNDFVMNEVALDYNSGFQMAVAGLLNDVAGGFSEIHHLFKIGCTEN